MSSTATTSNSLVASSSFASALANNNCSTSKQRYLVRSRQHNRNNDATNMKLSKSGGGVAKPYSMIGKTPMQVQRRNERERRRVQAVNHGYEVLAQQLADWDELKNKKLTKAQTLKAAIMYIQHMEKLLRTTHHSTPNSSSTSARKSGCGRAPDFDEYNYSSPLMNTSATTATSSGYVSKVETPEESSRIPALPPDCYIKSSPSFSDFDYDSFGCDDLQPSITSPSQLLFAQSPSVVPMPNDRSGSQASYEIPLNYYDSQQYYSPQHAFEMGQYLPKRHAGDSNSTTRFSEQHSATTSYSS